MDFSTLKFYALKFFGVDANGKWWYNQSGSEKNPKMERDCEDTEQFR